MKIAVVGGGINGIMAAWECAKKNHVVHLYERGKIMSATSSASTKLLHGGLRYLENLELMLVREALKERAWWLKEAPQLTNIIGIIIPIYENAKRSKWIIKIGLTLYDRLSGRLGIGNHSWLSSSEVVKRFPSINKSQLLGGYLFCDGQMDDYALGCWAAEKAKDHGVEFYEFTNVDKIFEDGTLKSNKSVIKYDKILNIAGPWSVKLLEDSGLPNKYKLDIVRGSHLQLNRSINCGLLLEKKDDNGIFFVLPYKDSTLLGTTEVRQSINSPIECDQSEVDHLINSYNNYFKDKIKQSDIIRTFTGVRPLIYSNDSTNKSSREFKIENIGNIIIVYGGKWTTSRALAKKVISYM